MNLKLHAIGVYIQNYKVHMSRLYLSSRSCLIRAIRTQNGQFVALDGPCWYIILEDEQDMLVIDHFCPTRGLTLHDDLPPFQGKSEVNLM